MAIYKKGSDPDALDKSAELLTQYSREVAGMRQTVSHVLGSLQGNWRGGTLEGLARQWPAIESQIDAFGDKLTQLSDRVSRNAAAQRGVSGQGGNLPAMTLAAHAAPGGAPGGGGGDDEPFWKLFLKQSNFIPDPDTKWAAWPALVSANLLFATSGGALGAQRLFLGKWNPRGPDGRFVTRPTGRWAASWAMRNDKNWVPKPYQAASSAKWATVGKWAGRAGTVVSFASSAFGQWNKDEGKGYDGVERGSRAAVAGATTAAGSWAGAWAGAQGGALVGAAIGGPVGAVVGGVVGGLIGGGVGGAIGSVVSDAIVGPVGHAVSEGIKGIGDGLSNVGKALKFW